MRFFLSVYIIYKIKTTKGLHKDATKMILDRLRMVSWSNFIFPTGVSNPVHERPTFPVIKLCNQKDIHFKHLLAKSRKYRGMFEINNPPYRDRGPTATGSS